MSIPEIDHNWKLFVIEIRFCYDTVAQSNYYQAKSSKITRLTQNARFANACSLETRSYETSRRKISVRKNNKREKKRKREIYFSSKRKICVMIALICGIVVYCIAVCISGIFIWPPNASLICVRLLARTQKRECMLVCVCVCVLSLYPFWRMFQFGSD